jgi:hypothetical protein
LLIEFIGGWFQMKKNNILSVLFIALFFVALSSTIAFAVAADDYDGDFEYCPDGTMVRDLRDCPDLVDRANMDSYDIIVRVPNRAGEAWNPDEEKDRMLITGRNPQTGKEIKIAARSVSDEELSLVPTSAKISIGDDVYNVGARISVVELVNYNPSSHYRCGVSRNNEIVCEVTPFDGSDMSRGEDHSLYCWGKGGLRECPSEQISRSVQTRGSGSGKVSVQDIKMSSRSEGSEGEIEVLSWSWGSSTLGRASDFSDADGDSVDFSYVWFVRGDDRPTESLSLSFGKIEITYSTQGGSKGVVEVDFPELSVSKNTLVFTTVVLDEFAVSENRGRCRVSTLLDTGDCDDTDPDVRPDIVVDVDDSTVNVESVQRALDMLLERVNDIKSYLERCDSDVCRQVSESADGRKKLLTEAKENLRSSDRYLNEVRLIVRQDIALLERCDTDVCLEVLAQERELLRLLNNYLDADLEGDGIPDYLDVDDDNDNVPTRAQQRARVPERIDRSTPVLFSAVGGDRLEESEKEEIREYLSSLSELRGRDLGLSIALIASENPRVREVRYNNETNTVEVKHSEEVRLLGFIRLNAGAHTTIDAEGNEETRLPWWAALARKSDNRVRFKAGADISKSVN